MEARKKGNSAGTLIVLLLLGLIALFALAPSLDQIKLRPHAVEKHGADAISARESVLNCSKGPRIKFCPRSYYGPSFAFWCPSPNSTLCPGMYITMGGIEKTSFIRPCEQWEICR